MNEAPRVLLLTADALGARMAGPAIRAFELARALHAGGCSPTIATPHLRDDLAPQPFEIVRYDPDRPTAVLAPRIAKSDALFLHITEISGLPFVADAGLPLIVDLYDPIIFETLEMETELDLETRERSSSGLTAAIHLALCAGDFFVCASERQRDLWLGALMAVGRVTPMAADEDPMLRRLIDVVPFGLSPQPPRTLPGAPPVLAGALPSIRPGDRILIWGGGIWNWFDPLTLIRAVASIAARRRDVHLVFLGAEHPNPQVPKMRMLWEARELAGSLGMLDRQVHFLAGWVPYEERGRYLLEGALGVSTHVAHAESRYAFRTRLLDCLWARLPIVCTRGDVLAELVEREGLGLTVPPGDAVALEAAIERLLDDQPLAARCRESLARVAPDFHWDEVAKPLVRFCRAPRLAADRAAAGRRGRSRRAAYLARRAAVVLIEHGPREVWRRAVRRWRFARE